MKIVSIHNALASGEDLWLTVRSDSSVLRNNDDFYMPSFSQDMRCTVGYNFNVKPGVFCEKSDESLANHTCCANDTYLVAFHTK